MIRELDIGETVSGRMSGDERRTQILKVAIKLFSQRGFSGTTTKEIARSAGVSEAMVFKHFANKEQLYSAILDLKAGDRRMQNQFEDLLKKTEAKDDFGVFYTMALSALNYHTGDSGFMRLMLHSALEEHDLARMFFESFVIEKYKFLGDYIEQRQADGVFREMDSRVVVRAFMGMFVQHSLYNILWDRDQKILDITNEEAARNFTEILLKGIEKK